MEVKFSKVEAENAGIAIATALACIAKVHAFISNEEIWKFYS